MGELQRIWRRFVNRTFRKVYEQRRGLIEEGNIWGIKTNLTIERGTGSCYSSGGYWVGGESQHIYTDYYNEKHEIFKPTDREYCDHCHGITNADERGNCCACGTPRSK